MYSIWHISEPTQNQNPATSSNLKDRHGRAGHSSPSPAELTHHRCLNLWPSGFWSPTNLPGPDPAVSGVSLQSQSMQLMMDFKHLRKAWLDPRSNRPVESILEPESWKRPEGGTEEHGGTYRLGSWRRENLTKFGAFLYIVCSKKLPSAG